MKPKVEVEFSELSFGHGCVDLRLLSKEGVLILQENTPGELNEPHWDTVEVYNSGSATYDLIKYLLK